MSQTSNPNWNLLADHALIYLPRQGKPQLIENFDYLPALESKRLSNGYNWVGFPALVDNNSTEIEAAFHYIIDLDDPFGVINALILENKDRDYSEWNSEGGGEWTVLGILNINSVAGYKLEIAHDQYSSFYYPVLGERIPVDTEIALEAGENWVNYFVPYSQHPSEALPQEVLDRLYSIVAEQWFLIYRNGEFYVKKECPPPIEEGSMMECYTLDYGNMYILNVSEPVTFTWNYPETPIIEPWEPPSPRSFEVQTASAYIPVVIDTIENGDGIAEIGAFQNGVCVGAEVVRGFPVNLKVYSNAVSGLTFEAVPASGTGAGKQIADLKPTVQSSFYDRGAYFMRLRLADNMDTATYPRNRLLAEAFPNPWNPVVRIRFEIEEPSLITIEIYNVAGEKVKTLVRGDYRAGYHTVTWDGINDRGQAVSSGVYVYSVSDGKNIIRKKMVFLK
jgi:hypothetical protein